ncbi:hypothetical protein [Yoonia sp.]|uniref:hypothetical protein n=1 Tax=Yoonia sp. TaxID=2212373 RepID=UPI0039751D67
MLRDMINFSAAAVLLGGAFQPALAEELAHGTTLIEDFSMQPESLWRFLTDQVMGGISTGGVIFAQRAGPS